MKAKKYQNSTQNEFAKKTYKIQAFITEGEWQLSTSVFDKQHK